MATNAYPLLALLRDSLATVPGVTTCKIGLEANMTPADYPMVRIVPSRLSRGDFTGTRGGELLIYFGQPIHEFTEGLEAQYESLLAMEATLVEKAERTAGVTVTYKETILDEDRVDAYKLMAIRMELAG